MSVAGRTRRGPTVTSYHAQLSDGQEFTVIADAVIVTPGAVRFTTGTSTSLIVAPRVWRSVRTADTSPLPATPAPAAKPASEVPVPVVPDTCYRYVLGVKWSQVQIL
jgi:hypothetical protein